MKTLKSNIVYLLVVFALVLVGCSKKADENKPVAEVKAEAQAMSVDKLRSMAETYKNAIVAKQAEFEKIEAKLKDPVTEMLGEEAKNLINEVDTLKDSVSALKERFQIYYDELKEKDGDLSGLTI